MIQLSGTLLSWINAQRGTQSNAIKMPLSMQERAIINTIATLESWRFVWWWWQQMQNDAARYQESIYPAAGGMEGEPAEMQVKAPCKLGRPLNACRKQTRWPQGFLPHFLWPSYFFYFYNCAYHNNTSKLLKDAFFFSLNRKTLNK